MRRILPSTLCSMLCAAALIGLALGTNHQGAVRIWGIVDVLGLLGTTAWHFTAFRHRAAWSRLQRIFWWLWSFVVLLFGVACLVPLS